MQDFCDRTFGTGLLGQGTCWDKVVDKVQELIEKHVNEGIRATNETAFDEWLKTYREFLEMPAATRWRRAGGCMMASVITTLLELGWDVPQPCTWVSPTGTTWAVQENEVGQPQDWSDFLT